MPSQGVRLKCAELFLTRETMLLECRCLFCHEWFERHDEFRLHLSTCRSSRMSSGVPDAKRLDDEDPVVAVKLEHLNVPECMIDHHESMETDFEDALQEEYSVDTFKIEQADSKNVSLSGVDEVSPPRPAAPSASNSKGIVANNTEIRRIIFARKQNEAFARLIMAAARNVRGKKVPLKCDLCGSAHKYRSEMSAHMMREHANKDVTCHRCGDTFLRHSDLSAHMRKYPVDPFTCEFCAATFTLKKNLVEHIRVHTGEKPYKCDECGRCFAQASALKKHVDIIHKGKKRFKCDSCGAAFGENKDLRRHIDNRHRNIQPEKRHKCDVCTMAFVRQHELRDHHRTHTGEKPFVCQFCQRSFGKRSALVVHENIHTGHSPFKCTHCDQSFHSSAARRSHEKRVHNVK